MKTCISFFIACCPLNRAERQMKQYMQIDGLLSVLKLKAIFECLTFACNVDVLAQKNIISARNPQKVGT